MSHMELSWGDHRLSELMYLRHRFLVRKNKRGLTDGEEQALAAVTAEIKSLRRRGHIPDGGGDGSLVVRGSGYPPYFKEIPGGMPRQ